MAMNFITGEQAAYERQANLNLNAKAAQINSKIGMINLNQGNADKAVAFIDKAIENYTAEKKFQWQQYVDFTTMNYNQIRDLDTKYQNILTNGMNMAKDAYDTQVAEKNTLRDMMIKYNPLGANISLDDTLDQAALKAGKVSTAEEWGAAYQLGDKMVQKNTVTGEIRSVSGTGDGSEVGSVAVSFYSDDIQTGIDDGKDVNTIIKDILTKMKEDGYTLEEPDLLQVQTLVQKMYNAKKVSSTSTNNILPAITLGGQTIKPSGEFNPQKPMTVSSGTLLTNPTLQNQNSIYNYLFGTGLTVSSSGGKIK
jgi:hypothetical protein